MGAEEEKHELIVGFWIEHRQRECLNKGFDDIMAVSGKHKVFLLRYTMINGIATKL